MTSTPTPKEIIGSFALAGMTLCLGVFFSTKVGGDGGTAIMRLFQIVTVLIVLKATFAWGRLRGFPARTEAGTIAVPHVVRNLVMAAIMCTVLLLAFGPLEMLAFKLAR